MKDDSKNSKESNTVDLKPSKALYDKLQDYAEVFKVILQMIIGFGLVFLLILRLFDLSKNGLFSYFDDWFNLSNLSSLQIVGYALAYATGVELAYTLFTDGPDEAVNPLLLAVASSIILLLASTGDSSLQQAVSILILSIALFIIFYIRKHYLDDKEN